MGSRSTEPGHQAEVFRDQDGNLQVPSGAGVYMLNGSSFDLESGSHMRIKSGGSLYSNAVTVFSSNAQVNFDSGVPLTMGAGSTLSLSSGATFRATSGSIVRNETVQIMTTKGTTAVTSFLHGYGVSVIRPDGTGGTYRMKRPVKGVSKTIIIQSTLANKISCTSTHVNFGSTAKPQKFSFTATPSTQAVTKAGGFAISLIGLSSSVWAITGFGAIMGSSLNSGIILVATAT